ncbi:PhnD/SsuA/transferrin family substrate-binding protein [Marimonas arenosa]|uniref:PhnD/SsuA/transferrin family substrate-binding protein n=1 Tax=Marimonas arenosa TaxID=1795305 RepID=A0AAE4B6Q6_9RHOB|nr:PhnD/SsuA/transferrin family substrate-binding protein [Marimonas arenosa]MDQ2091594.1 PhnD/SsuA/transferrin family substrate-binding protein [Marimonas arenosa]
MRASIRLALLCLLMARPTGGHTQDNLDNELRIGILAHRGWPGIERYWTPLETYVAGAFDMPTRLVPVTLASAGPLIENGTLNFLITNPGHFVALEKRHPMSVIATLRRRLSDGSDSSEFGSVIFSAAGSDISTLKDAVGRRVTAVDPRAFGGYQVAWLEFTSHGFDPASDFSELNFVGFPQDQIIDQVLSGVTDIGIVRSGLIETRAAEGTLDPARIRVLNSNASFTHPDALSTRLYPEWPFLAMAGTPGDLRDRMALALLQTQDPAVRAAHGLHDGWGAPLSYHAVRALDAAFAERTSASPSGTSAARYWVPVLFVLAAALALGFAMMTFRARRVTQPTPAQEETTEPVPAGPTEPPVQLTQRESEILALVAQGLSSKEIARNLGISPKTVEFHRSNLLRKHDAKSAAELVQKAAVHGQNPET